MQRHTEHAKTHQVSRKTPEKHQNKCTLNNYKQLYDKNLAWFWFYEQI